MSLLGLILLIVVICVVLQYVAMPGPVHTILVIVAVVLAILCLIVVLQLFGLVPALFDTPARLR